MNEEFPRDFPKRTKVTTDNDDEDNDETNTSENNIIVECYSAAKNSSVDSKLRNAT